MFLLNSTMDILNDYAEKDDCVHVFRNEENLGFLKNFEKAIRICLDRGAEYVALSDQDDVWMKNHLEVLLNTISSGGGGDISIITRRQEKDNRRLTNIP